VYITNEIFENKKESVLPSLFVILYADWEGKISLTLEGGFAYTHAFNNGLRVFKDGEICLNFEEYPYESPLSAETEDGFVWDANLTLNANTDLTVFGGSVLFFVAGINIGEFSVARLGVQAECELTVKGDSKQGVKILENEDTKFYIRGYLKIVEVKLKLIAEGKAILSKLKIDEEFEFALLDLELFEFGHRPDKYKPKVPVSSMERPDEFESVMTLVCDVSGSMDSYVSSGETKLAAAKEAAKTIVDISEDWSTQYEGNYGIGVIMFADYAETVALPHIDYQYINDCIDTMYNGGGTQIYNGIDAAVAQLENTEAKEKTIILMTDGQDYNDTYTLASAQAAADLGIKIYTIGFGNDVNEDILMQVAELTGGEYRYASTDDLLGIESSFMYAQQASNAKVLEEVEGAVSEGELSEGSYFYVQEGNGNLMVATTWPGSFMETILIDPHGRRVDENYPGATVDESKIPSSIVVTNPIQGRWFVRIKGVETSYDNEPFYTIVSYKATKADKVNKEMSQLQEIAAYCIPVGIVAAVTSGVLLAWLRKMEKSAKKERTMA
jgi:Mg-chelatase subunit ChlD